MPDDHNADGDESNGDSPAPSRLTNGKPESGGGKSPQPPHSDHAAAASDKAPTYKTLWREIRVIDLTNCLVGIAMLIVACAAYKVASDTSDIKSAVSNISALATQTKRQADDLDVEVKTLGGEFGEMQKQTGALQTTANAASGQLHEMRDEQRPIVDVATIESVAPLQIDPVIGAYIRFNLVNSGKSAAILTYPHAKFILNSSDPDVLKRAKEACSAPVKAVNGNTTLGFNIRAGVSMPIDMGYVLTAEETKTWKAKPELRMLVVGCIDYMFDGRHHHTPFVQEIDRRDTAGSQGWMPINPNTDKVDTGGLVFLIPPWYTAQPD